ncbi:MULTISPECIES: response regulator transcription factor [unclassified Methylobacterium]|jgi:DNA-binding response OmpR family regulator|uniref:response regulator transcription factor n=1 Tax=unclassified Methylobacterium TaxID=2615210 RepID=UPI0006F1E3C4|nr:MULTISPECIES: response regulator transcription factor [unclassified Methylobacterium]KQO74875.1 two-component system response regulator [Methylobacterium sp. Leaf89]KQO78352.1 two-component system response regulator [Methylobacterium sp. Leaf88]KQP74588.1 two-component system response regulator [Methylobacterium sp. Leaf111]KQQ42476.1 two-component system response regulator [Methylobacterium sp. Leaf125]KQT70456.1 two-component system response regulator [Methylobacterium sp. Leaf465]
MTRVLIVEDDSDIRAMLARGLEAEGFSVGVAGRVDDALAAARAEAPEAVVLDITLPDGSGHDVCRSLREGGYPGPILFLSARDEVRDRAEGLALGADDYIVKPFVFDELLARLQTHLLRRKASEEPRTLVTAGKLMLDLTVRQVGFADATARLTPREAELLALLMDNANHPVSRGDIFDKLWAGQGGLSLNVVDVYVGYLRTKLSDFVRLGGPVIVTVRGRGFMLDLKGQDFRH